MATPIVIVTKNGLPVTLASNGRGAPMTIATNGYGMPVQVVASGGMPVTGFTVGPDITAPIITSSNTISQPENTALVHFLSANEAVTWAKVGGADSAKFTLGSGATAGQLSLPAKDYEAPDDANADRAYIVQVQATDLAANPSAIQTITVTITDVFEPGPTTGQPIGLLLALTRAS